MEANIQINSSLVNKYIDQLNHQTQAEIDRLEKIGMDGLPKFEDNVWIWLGSLKEEIDEFEPATWQINEQQMVQFMQCARWNGCEVVIISSGWGLRFGEYTRPATWLKISIPGDPFGREPFSMRLRVKPSCGVDRSGEYNDEAEPVDETALGGLLAEVIRQMEAVANYRKNLERKAREDTLKTAEAGYDQIEDLDAVRKYHAQICAQLPDHLDRWNAAMRRRQLAIAAEQEKKRQAEEEAALVIQEEKRLDEEAARLFRPFTVYRLRVGVKLPDETELRLLTVYATTAVPNESGWFTQVHHGDLIPYRPETLIDVARIDVDSPAHDIAPLVCRRVELVSDRIPYMTEVAFGTPEGLG